MLAQHLEDAGFQVTTSADGAGALSLLATAPAFDALVTDLSMPGVDGLSVIRAARASCPSMPALLLTGYAGDEAALALGIFNSGMVSLLRKPVGSVELIDRLGAMLAMKCDADGFQAATVRSSARENFAAE